MDALADLEDRRDRRDRPQRRRRVVAVFAGQLQRQVAAERVAGHRDGRQAVDRRQLVDDVPGVGGQARVEQAGRQMLGVAAVPLVQPHDVHAAGERLGGDAAHVVRVARAVQPVQEQMSVGCSQGRGCQWQCASTRASCRRRNSGASAEEAAESSAGCPSRRASFGGRSRSDGRGTNVSSAFMRRDLFQRSACTSVGDRRWMASKELEPKAARQTRPRKTCRLRETVGPTFAGRAGLTIAAAALHPSSAVGP